MRMMREQSKNDWNGWIGVPKENRRVLDQPVDLAELSFGLDLNSHRIALAAAAATRVVLPADEGCLRCGVIGLHAPPRSFKHRRCPLNRLQHQRARIRYPNTLWTEQHQTNHLRATGAFSPSLRPLPAAAAPRAPR